MVAGLAVVVLHLVLDAFSNSKVGNIWYQMQLSSGEVVVTVLVVLGVGVVIGSLGSALGIRRFLDA